MTREEAIAVLREKYDYCKSFYDFAAHPEEDYPEMTKYLYALQIAFSALRPITREQVEKVWRGEWKGVPKLGVYDMACSKCGYSTGIRFYSSEFCPNCGAPMTDKAVDMVMERLGAVKDEAETN